MKKELRLHNEEFAFLKTIWIQFIHSTTSLHTFLTHLQYAFLCSTILFTEYTETTRYAKNINLANVSEYFRIFSDNIMTVKSE